jgi:chromosome segregation ATPase
MMVTLSRESEKELQKEYQRSLEENKQLVESLQSQLKELNKYMVEKKEFNDTHARIYAELSISNEALKERKEDIEKSREVIRELRFTLDEKDVIVRSVETKNHQLHVDLTDCYGKIEEMKRIKNAVEEEASELRRKEAAYKTYFADKEQEIADMTGRIEDLERRVSEFNITKRSLDSKIALLTQKMTSD